MFPQFYNKRVTIVQANKTGEWQDEYKYKYKFKEWLKTHYVDFEFEVLKGDTRTKLFDYVLQKKNVFLVMGAYGRNAISHFFKHSQADLLIKTTTQPIFITHN